jgi:hypothetical protein
MGFDQLPSTFQLTATHRTLLTLYRLILKLVHQTLVLHSPAISASQPIPLEGYNPFSLGQTRFKHQENLILLPNAQLRQRQPRKQILTLRFDATYSMTRERISRQLTRKRSRLRVKGLPPTVPERAMLPLRQWTMLRKNQRKSSTATLVESIALAYDFTMPRRIRPPQTSRSSSTTYAPVVLSKEECQVHIVGQIS